MSESPKQFEQAPLSEELAALEKLNEHPFIISAEPSPYKELVDSYVLKPELASELESALGKQYGTFLDLVEGIKFYLGGPLIKDTFGNAHLEISPEHDGLSRRDFIRSYGEQSIERSHFDRNRLKLGTHCNAIFPRLELLEMFAGSAAPRIAELFADLPRDIYQKQVAHEEISESEKEQWVREMDSFAERFLKETSEV